MTSVLVSGASIAGPALAYWLTEYGMTVTVVERAPELRTGGQSVDVRGAGRTVAQRMGIEDAILAANTGEEGVQFVDERGAVQGAFPTSGDSGPTAELEILRGDLSRVVYETSADRAEYLFGESIAGVVSDADSVHVTFASGTERTFDYLVIAEGMRSRTRALVFDDAEVSSLGMYTAYLTVPRTASDTQWARWCAFPGRRTALFRPDNQGTTRALLSFMTDTRGYDALDVDGQKDVLRRVFADAGWEVPRALAALDSADDLYFEDIGQVRVPAWSTERTVLLGDAGYCASPISGMGTSLALVGAYVLAGEMAAGPGGFARYESIMRPYVAQAQKLPPGAPRLANPKSRLGIATFNTAVKVASSPLVRRLFTRFSGPPADGIELPRYGT